MGEIVATRLEEVAGLLAPSLDWNQLKLLVFRWLGIRIGAF